jgi:hypothetical protein
MVDPHSQPLVDSPGGTPGPSTGLFRTGSQSSSTRNSRRGNRRGRSAPRDGRNFQNTDELRGIIQALEQRQSDSLLEITELRNHILELRNRPLPSTENPTETRTLSDPPGTPSLAPHPRKTVLTEKIIPLDEGYSPTFKQWKASVMDRLDVNFDHYPTERSRLALIWGTTTGKAKDYLEPRYTSDSHPFTHAEDMIDLLASYYLTGNETEEARNEFHDLSMGKGHSGETFSEFQARFLSKAIKGNVAKSEWFFYMWNKLTPQLRNATVAWKSQWHNSYQVMVEHLMSIDNERRRNLELNPTSTTPTSIGNASKKPATPSLLTKPFTPRATTPLRTVSTFPRKPTPGTDRPTTQFRSGTPRTDQFKSTTNATSSDACYRCHKVGHYSKQCPTVPNIQEMATVGQDDDGTEELEEDSEVTREENDEA